jgi:hypothetical protein
VQAHLPHCCCCGSRQHPGVWPCPH